MISVFKKLYSSKIRQFHEKNPAFSPKLFFVIFAGIMQWFLSWESIYYAFFECVSSSLRIDSIGSHISGKQMAFHHNESSCVCQPLTPSCSKLDTFLVSKLYQNWPRQTLSCPETILFQAKWCCSSNKVYIFLKGCLLIMHFL